MDLRLLIFLLFSMFTFCCCKQETKKIAVIGGGIGGTATAYFLRNFLHPQPKVDVFEDDEVGGRLALATVGGKQYELGGAIIHPRNKHAVTLVQELGLKRRAEPPASKVSLFDGEKVVFEESGWSVVDLARMAWRYGPMTLYNANSQLQQMLANFDKIYAAQEKGQCFERVSDLLSAMSPTFPNMTTESAETIEGISPEFLREIVGAALRVNYAQYVQNATKFVTFVSLAGSEGDLWAVEGGNQRLPYQLLAAADAFLVPHKVDRIEPAPSGSGYTLYWDSVSDVYDAVIIATPLNGTLGLPVEASVTVRPMEDVWVTLVEASGINPSAFGQPVDEVIAVGPAWLNSMSKVWPVDSTKPEKPVYKIFSASKPSEAQLAEVLEGVGETRQHLWPAYPHYDWSDNADAPFALLPGLIHNNAIEWAASAMEMSLVSARNAANCAAHHLGLSTSAAASRDEL
ncbi:prenylcysteine oxidase 1-like [Neocloeon triangulifer]|uniref:prenylcysteine oxidase 1-like n=1 Tax=Neocloeon triangulifer TaxID=2078957 RepID=UPI00286EEE8B|nr:prenylcysteine oxidase 1-like [Neocloeon triangulifer]XP_059477693.1 prenylcysteine oxidase 1-like [Neocloeon triangulifer]